MDDRGPDRRSEPPAPEDAAPGARLSLTVEQIIKIERTVVEFAEAVRVEIEERGAGLFEVTIYGHDGVELARHTVFPL